MLTLAVASFAVARPPGEFAMMLLLNGEPTRPVQSDGGGLLLSVASGIASIPVTGGQTYLITAPISAACPSAIGSACLHVCVGGDGGCSATATNPSYGLPVATGGALYVVTRDATATIYAVSPDGGAVSAPPF